MVEEKIIFIDSDGTAIDSMNFKHINCFGPALIDTFGLNEYKEIIQNEWNRINLFSLTRGINRFDGLYQMLTYVNEKLKPIEILDEYKYWLDTTEKKSNQKLIEYIEHNHKEILQIVIDWSNETNRRIKALQEEVKPFEAVKPAIEALAQNFTIVVISSANREAILHEWNKFGLAQYAREICTQEIGTKEACIAKVMKEMKPGFAVMVGDALGDLNAAVDNKISFYPICPGLENDSWGELVDKYQEMFKDGTYTQIEEQVINHFKNILDSD